MPFSLGMLLELLFGELGPEPGALLHAESETHTHTHTYQIHARRHSNLKTKFLTTGCATACPSPAMSSERFLAVVMGLSRRRSSGLLLRSLTFCFSRERSFKFGSEAERGTERDGANIVIHSWSERSVNRKGGKTDNSTILEQPQRPQSTVIVNKTDILRLYVFLLLFI